MGFTGPMEDRLAIRELYDAYADGANRMDRAAWLATVAANLAVPILDGGSRRALLQGMRIASLQRAGRPGRARVAPMQAFDGDVRGGMRRPRIAAESGKPGVATATRRRAGARPCRGSRGGPS